MKEISFRALILTSSKSKKKPSLNAYTSSPLPRNNADAHIGEQHKGSMLITSTLPH